MQQNQNSTRMPRQIARLTERAAERTYGETTSWLRQDGKPLDRTGTFTVETRSKKKVLKQ